MTFILKIKNIFGHGKDNRQKRMLIYLFFVFISSVFWLLDKLNNEYVTDLKCPVTYINLPVGKGVPNSSRQNLKLKVKASGYTLLKCRLESVLDPVTIDAVKYRLHSTGNRSSIYYFLSKYLNSSIVNQLHKDLNIIEIQPDTVFFDLSGASGRAITIKPLR
ncbi:MAG: hypothetical protein NTW49_05275 [Bacteroidia bacterium]|nr:hypothetical protein [Bacteroidia bacterium]